jgi:REP element-mobilizing transposase RayT
MTALEVGGTEDHIHLLVLASAIHSPSDIAKWIKVDSSKWIRETFPDLHAFGWQDGYGAFTVSKNNLAGVISYIQHQHEHHQKRSFQEEYREFLKKAGIDYDERYLWG